MAHLRGFVARLSKLPDRRLRILAPGVRHGEGHFGVQRFLASVFPDNDRDLERVLGVALRLREHPFEHPVLGHRRENAGSGLGGLRRHQFDGALVRGERSFVIPGRAAVVAELLHDEAQRQPFARIVEACGSGFGIGGGSGGFAGAERGLTGAQIQVRQPVVGLSLAGDFEEAEGRFVVDDRVRARIQFFGFERGFERGVLRVGQLMGGEVMGVGCGRVPSAFRVPGAGERGVVAAARRRQQVRGHGLGDELVAEADRPARLHVRGRGPEQAVDAVAGHIRPGTARVRGRSTVRSAIGTIPAALQPATGFFLLAGFFLAVELSDPFRIAFDLDEEAVIDRLGQPEEDVRLDRVARVNPHRRARRA